MLILDGRQSRILAAEQAARFGAVFVTAGSVQWVGPVRGRRGASLEHLLD